MRITLVVVGRLKEAYWRDAVAEYLKRLRPYAAVQVIEVPDRDVSRDELGALVEEGAAVLKAVPEGAHVIALALSGRRLSSEQFAEEISGHMVEGRSHLVFVIGGAAGLAQTVLDRADTYLSLGPLTLPHQLARVVLVEQIYRAFRIIRGEPYHR
ncbi:MAG: 23S rRNA (pseudouridine(1915)-N(3))-methyltransferase RlmH [Coriobacteriia bacterium]|jgi:23S rRNA (pseudouridine1915-N3)-methyltransferase|nr:23S rRNA (pseudouridine(1915)-N(3))-methyltransferase RlmH [Coriobacteriia bacterium]